MSTNNKNQLSQPNRLSAGGLILPNRFVVNPHQGAGELVAFRYAGGTTPQHLVFPVGSSKINWLTLLRGSIRFGQALTRSKNLPNGPLDPSIRLDALELKRLRFWRSFDFISECCRSSGMTRYEPFAIGCGLYDREALNLHPKSVHERSILYLGDHFSRNNTLLSDMVHTRDLWLLADAVYQNRNDIIRRVLEAEEKSAALDWEDALQHNRTRFEGDELDASSIIESSVLNYRREGVGRLRKNRLIEFANNVLTKEQRDSLCATFVHPNEGTSQSFIDALIISPCRTGVYEMLHSLLKIINFSILNTIGYDAHRIMMFKIFVPALLAVFLSNGGLGDVFENGAFQLKLFHDQSGKTTIGSILERSAMRADANRQSKNYAKYDSATLNGELTESSADLPLAINIGVSLKKCEYEKKILNMVNDNIINSIE